MKITVDLPEHILEQTIIAAACRQTSVENLVIEGLETVLRDERLSISYENALTRLRKGYHLGGEPLKREDIHNC